MAIFSRTSDGSRSAARCSRCRAAGRRETRARYSLWTCAQLELERQPAVGQLVLDDDQQAGRVAVEPMDDPRPIFAGQRRERVVVELECVDQGAAPVPSGRVGDHPRRLVHDRQSLVLVDDLDRDVFGLRRRVGQIGQADADPVAGPDAIRGLHQAGR